VPVGDPRDREHGEDDGEREPGAIEEPAQHADVARRQPLGHGVAGAAARRAPAASLGERRDRRREGEREGQRRDRRRDHHRGGVTIEAGEGGGTVARVRLPLGGEDRASG
jgi:hypothetical protein